MLDAWKETFRRRNRHPMRERLASMCIMADRGNANFSHWLVPISWCIAVVSVVERYGTRLLGFRCSLQDKHLKIGGVENFVFSKLINENRPISPEREPALASMAMNLEELRESVITLRTELDRLYAQRRKHGRLPDEAFARLRELQQQERDLVGSQPNLPVLAYAIPSSDDAALKWMTPTPSPELFRRSWNLALTNEKNVHTMMDMQRRLPNIVDAWRHLREVDAYRQFADEVETAVWSEALSQHDQLLAMPASMLPEDAINLGIPMLDLRNSISTVLNTPSGLEIRGRSFVWDMGQPASSYSLTGVSDDGTEVDFFSVPERTSHKQAVETAEGEPTENRDILPMPGIERLTEPVSAG